MAAVAVLLVAALGFAVADRSVARSEQPAPSSALARVAAKNDAAATLAAARMKADSEQQAQAVDRMADARDRGAERADAMIAASELPNRQLAEAQAAP